jgi:hypothetical protein
MPRRYQFSIRDLLRLTVVVSIALGTAFHWINSQRVSTSWLWLAFAGAFATWYYGRWRRLLEPSVARSFWFYVISLAMPAIALDTYDVIPGALAWLQSYCFGPTSIPDLIHPRPSAWPKIGIELPLACLLGAIANTLIVLSWIGFYLAWRKRKELRAARWLARGAAVFMVACLAPLMHNRALPTIYPGYALWLASAVVMMMRAS